MVTLFFYAEFLYLPRQRSSINTRSNFQEDKSMEERIIRTEDIERYQEYLRMEEKSAATIEKYSRDVGRVKTFAGGRAIDKELMMEFKEQLMSCGHFKISSINSYLETVNRFLEFMGWYDARVKPFKTQQQCFQEEDRYMSRTDYKKLLKEAKKQGKKRLYIIIETIASTGIRISELCFITAESVRKGVARIYNKGKVRKIILTKELCTQLLLYMAEKKIKSGPVFISRNGNPLNRSNIWKEMKELAEKAGVSATKVFPHNLRKLFATCLYKADKDIAKVADILGHSRIDTTRRYIRETFEEHRSMLERLGLVDIYG